MLFCTRDRLYHGIAVGEIARRKTLTEWLQKIKAIKVEMLAKREDELTGGTNCVSINIWFSWQLDMILEELHEKARTESKE